MNPDNSAEPCSRNYVHWTKIRPLVSDIDFNGHVNHIAILRYFEHARLAVPLRADSLPGDAAYLLARIEADFTGEVLLDSLVEIGMRISRIRRTSLVLEQVLTIGDATSAKSLCTFVKVDPASRAPTAFTAQDMPRFGFDASVFDTAASRPQG
ncbi:thioesterase family protein [Erythrobacter sp. AP23]|uniref:acyl-CoA thioesterase n=1 Tax=Erythrobacter sp. AP23 TaxID=499656 RepID=UPI00076BFE57|nr:thioesterase family protein [Erythrobacter sp. AP23]KWV93769.1 hypothetical protein ASS64_12805 [Erythrobacter sp. AP23]